MASPTAFPLSGSTALLTGAASGIGAALALALAERGCHLALVDVHAERLRESAAAARARGGPAITITEHAQDLARPDAAAAVLDAAGAAHPRFNLLINNAGVALGGTFEQVAEDDFDWLLRINFHTPVKLVRTFLPLLQREPVAQIVNVSSVFGIVAPPGQTAYCAAKFALRGFSESLRHELERAGSPIGVTVVHPGGVRTRIAESSRVPRGVTQAEIDAEQLRWRKVLVLSPEDAAARILQGIVQREKRVLVGKDAVQIAWLQRLMPVNHWKWIARDLERRIAKG